MALSRRTALQAAEKLVARGRLEAAVKQYRKALAESPDDTGTLNRLGDLYARLDQVDGAVEMFTAAADRFAKEGFFVKAIAIYKKIIRLDPTLIQVYETLADLYHRQGLVNEARSQYQVVADYYRQAEDNRALVAVFEKMVDLEPENPSHRLKLAEFYCGSEQIPQAMEQYQKIAQFMLEHGKVEEAFRVYLGAFELKVDDLGFLTDIIVQLTDLGHDEAAKKLLDHAIERNPDATRVAELVDLPVPDVAERRGGSLPSESIAGVDEELPDVAPSSPKSTKSRPSETRTADDAITIEVVSEGPAESSRPTAQAPPAEALEVVAEAELVEVEAGEPASTSDPDSGSAAADDETGEFEIALDVIELVDSAEPVESADPLESESLASRADELVTEANVLSNYGLESKAVELLESALQLAPAHSEAVELLLHLHQQDGRVDEVVAVAQRYSDGGFMTPRLADLLSDWDYRIEDGKVLAPLVATVEVEEVTVEPEVAPAADDRLDWLDEESTFEKDAGAESLFGEEDEFFDLAAELEEELLAEEEGSINRLMPQVEEQSIEEIVEGFKQGVAETLSTEDYDTHYNLGIAYREMGLVDEAIGEFQLAAKSDQFLVDCCSLLGAAFLEKGFPDLAAKWYERGLKAPKVSDEEKLGLLYELGNLYLSTGRRQTAKTTFAEIYGANSNYRDVVAKLEELRQE